MLEQPNKGSLDSEENKQYKDFDDRINKFVELYLRNYFPSGYDKTKVVHDPVWGTTLFYPWELQILDSPLLQRLRNISQLGLAMLTYPSAHHTRFEHTLGVMSVVTKMVNHINHETVPAISNEEFYTLRLAALLHDVGHSFCSHLSESIYGNLIEFVNLKKSFRIFQSAKEHEIFAYIIINTTSFKKFVKDNVKLWETTINLDKLFVEIGYMIVGAELPCQAGTQGGHERRYYMTQIINGQYDADKLDYLRRDSYTAGLALTYDIDRFLYKIKIAVKEEIIDEKTVWGKHLVIPVTGISAVEEMAFSQLMLASYIYQHQKVLATDALVHDIVKVLSSNGKLEHPCDFLHYCDNDLFGIHSDNPDDDFRVRSADKNFDPSTPKKIADIVKRINNRDLPKRAFTVNYATIIKDTNRKQYRVSDIADRLRSISKLREEICEIARKISSSLPKDAGAQVHIDLYDIHIAIPKTSIAKDLSNALVLTNTGDFVSLSEIVRLSDWADAFAWHKWNAYVFSKVEILPIVSIAAKIVFERHKIEFDENTVFSNIKSAERIKELIQILKDNGNYPL